MSKDIYSHFHPTERAFVEQAIDWIDRAVRSRRHKLTDFLDPRQTWILTTLANREPDALIRFSGGYPEAERKRAIIAFADTPPEHLEFSVTRLSIVPKGGKFLSLNHGDYLGSLLSLGIKRDKVGDLLVTETDCQCLLATEIADFIRMNLRQVGRTSVTVDELPLAGLPNVQPAFSEMRFTVASLRLDAIIGDVCRLSRAKAQIPIKAGRCRVNWKTEEDSSRLLQEGDVISLTGFGRFKVLEIAGNSKKGRIFVKVGKYL
ncbi:MAG TPA: YlmH/Sll1252 family protein [Bacilli bacterium]